ncbi:DUF3617 domain-containing protein [Hirschia baltica]|uniref:DUF3617 family protein n=1 Tax=Hirschia baltica (strain ATCC 49814 / DSM 5838 / IFAM 1418) TaxID=582402 RepID=C6XN08_HIRBI|nr:DUF3617 family protein [Hirschia baltica]ACT58178.1 hypothetical protein Hbal_0476 [Hirschia baltica ATCC 49814]
MVKSLTTFGAIAASLTLAMSAALAAPNETEGKRIIAIEPGAWEWTHETMIGPAPITSTETQCVTPDEATVSLNDIVEDLSGYCAMADVTTTEKGYAFKLNCDGDVKGIANGELSASRRAISLNASGAASFYGMMAPFTIQADAKYVGACE